MIEIQYPNLSKLRLNLIKFPLNFHHMIVSIEIFSSHFPQPKKSILFKSTEMKRALEDPPITAAASAASAIQVSFPSTAYKESENKTKNKQTKTKSWKVSLFRCLYQANEPPATSPVPDLRVDFFTEAMDNVQKRHSYVEITMKQINASSSDMSSSLSNTNMSISNATNTMGINVTSNPMDETAANVTCTTQTPRATIVVQQVI